MKFREGAVFSAKCALVDVFSRVCFGGQFVRHDLGDRKVTAQVFNVLSKGRSSSTAVVFVPGFNSIPNLQPPGVIGATAGEHGCDFARFYHPDLVSSPARTTYDRLLADAERVISGLPHEKIVLAGSSFGGGMLPLLADSINGKTPGRVAGLFGWMSVPPVALLDLIRRQDHYEDILTGEAATLPVHSPSLSQPLHLTLRQVVSVTAADILSSVQRPFSGVALLYSGKDDPVGKPPYSDAMIAQLQTKKAQHKILDAGHKIKPELIARGLHQVLEQV